MSTLLRAATMAAVFLASCGGSVGSAGPTAAVATSTTLTAPTETPTLPTKTNDATTKDLFCGVLSANTITSGQGSGPNTFELRPTTSVRTGTIGSARFGGWVSSDRPALGTYVCVWLGKGAPMGGFLSQVRAASPATSPKS